MLDRLEDMFYLQIKLCDYFYLINKDWNVSGDIKFVMILLRFRTEKKVKKIVEQTNFQEKSVHITLELACLEIKAANLYLDWLFYVSRIAQNIASGRFFAQIVERL